MQLLGVQLSESAEVSVSVFEICAELWILNWENMFVR